MGDIITDNDLLELTDLLPAATDQQLKYAARRASSLVAGNWASPIDPAPQWVKDIAIDVAARYLANPRGVTSVTRSLDDASRTERYEGGGTRAGKFYLDDDEFAKLNPKVRTRVGSTRLHVPGVCRP